VNSALKDVFLGQIVVGDINYISLIKGLHIASAKVLDPSGKEVLQAKDIVARVSAVGVVKSVLFGDETHIKLPFIRIEHVDALIQAENGKARVWAFLLSIRRARGGAAACSAIARACRASRRRRTHSCVRALQRVHTVALGNEPVRR